MENPKEEHSPIGNIAFGLLMVAVGIGAYFYFAYIERQGGRIRTHALVILVYSTLGKWGVLGLFGALGAFIAGKGVFGAMKSKRESPEVTGSE